MSNWLEDFKNGFHDAVDWEMIGFFSGVGVIILLGVAILILVVMPFVKWTLS